MKTCVSTIALVIIAGAASAATSPDWAIHEWGTFTSLQDEHGAAIGGINTEDEALPKFAHRLADMLEITPTEIPPSFFQGAPHCHPDVTMRMETPVIYFHPPAGTEAGAKVNVQVTFNGGWLSEFYPQAEISVPGLESNRFNFGPLFSSTVSTLRWPNLEVGGDFSGPKTDSHVWTSPRQVQSAPIRTANGEEEQFLFYRGVAHIDAPLKISSDGGELIFRSQLEGDLASGAPLPIKSLWLVDIHPDGKIAYRVLPALTLDGDQATVLEKVRSDFKPSDYRLKNFDELESTLKKALVANGLFADEAQALLNTWEISYFKSAGLRVFFIVPRAWTDHYLPLKISVPAQINRVMVGRIELVTPEQKENLRAIAALSPEQIKADDKTLFKNILGEMPRAGTDANNERKDFDIRRLESGAINFVTAGVTVPKSFQYYLDLGRFRNALVLNEMASHPTEGLKAFVAAYHLDGYKPVQVSQN